MPIRLIALIIFALIIITTGIALSKIDRLAQTGAGYMAKVLCSEVFVAGRAPEVVRSEEFNNIHPLMDRLSTRVDRKRKRVRASLFGLGQSTAIYRDAVGCTLATGKIAPVTRSGIPVAHSAWPTALTDDENRLLKVNYEALDAAFARAEADVATGHRALLVAVDGKLVGEWYADGFDKSTPMLSWSAAKSVLATLIGIAVQKELIGVEDPIPVREWQDDPERAVLTWNDLLRMHSGLDFEEDYANPTSAVNQMLFAADSTASVAAKSLRTSEPGTHFNYSSGTSNLLSRALGDVVTTHQTSLNDFATANFFTPLGITDTILEVDAAGDFIGSSYVYAPAREWLKMGQLYLQNGMWNGEQILPEGWAGYVSTVTPSSKNQYGAHFWLNREGPENAKTGKRPKRFFPGLPEESYFFAGRDGQYVIIVPIKNMVIVRLGLTRVADASRETAPTIRQLYEAISVDQ